MVVSLRRASAAVWHCRGKLPRARDATALLSPTALEGAWHGGVDAQNRMGIEPNHRLQ